MVALIGLNIWFIKGNFGDLKQGQQEILDKMVGREICGMKHVAVNADLERHQKNITRLFRLVAGEDIIERKEDHNGD